jgi:Peptidase family S41/Tricorn protease C1 domain
MKQGFIIAALLTVQLSTLAQSNTFSTAQYKQDFNFFWTSINEEYCYFNKKKINWPKVKEFYLPMMDTITSRASYVSILEKALYEIYDHHAGLNTNNDDSRRLVPTAIDVWAAYINGKPVITEVRKGFGAKAAGIIAGMEVVAVNDVPVQQAIEPFLPVSAGKADNEAKSFALRLLLAGNHIQPRKLTMKYGAATSEYYPDKTGMQLEHIQYATAVEATITSGIGYIKINNNLGDDGLIQIFDSVMHTMRNTRALVLDLRETPSGGNTNVARAILGWFINKEHFYQKHEYAAEEKATGIKRSWVEIVSPGPGKYYSKPLAVLCNHWTGSVGEGIVIGFDALKRPATITIGTDMARLSGAVYGYEMPNTKIHFSFPAERLYHINGQPREQYLPGLFVDMMKEKKASQQDIILEKAIEYLDKKQR